MKVTFALALSLALPSSAVSAGALARVEPELRATRILVDKSDRVLTLYRGDIVLRTFRVRLGGNPVGHKRQEGDERTPEGHYEVDYKNPDSKFHLSLHISYPNTQDRADAVRRNVHPGKDIMVHGGNYAWRPFNWTDGCIAVKNNEIEEIWSLVDVGTPIEIVP